MIGAASYIDNCVDAIEAIRHTGIAQMPLGERIGSGGRSTMYTLREVELEQASIFLGVKVPTDTSGKKRLEFELSAMDVIGGKIPEFIPKLPAFLGYIALDEATNPVALLTEDVTKGGHSSNQIRPFKPGGKEPLRSRIYWRGKRVAQV